MYPGSNNPSLGFGQGASYSLYPTVPFAASPYPPAPGAAPYPPAGGAAPYPPAGGMSPYPPALGAAPYPPASGVAPPAPYPPTTAPYPPTTGAAPYPPAPGASPYPPAPGAAPYPPAGGAAPYPPSSGAAPYPPAGGSSPYPPAPGAGAYPPAPGAPAYPPASGAPGYPPAPAAPGYPPATGAPGYPPATGAQGYPPYGQPAVTSYGGSSAMTHHHHHQHTGTPHGGSLSPYREIPTVTHLSHFDPSSDAAILRKAMKGLGTDEAAIIGVLARRTSDQRQQIMLKYQQAYGRDEDGAKAGKGLSGDLIKDLKSELSGKFEDTIVALMTPLPVFLAHEVHNAIQGIGTNERTLVEVLCTRDNASLMTIKNAYYHTYRKKLEDDLRGDTSGDFRRLLISMCACSRDETNCDPALANSLAQQLYKAGVGKVGTDEAEFNRILSSYSYQLLRIVFEEYRKIKGKSFGDALDSELSGDLKIGMKAVYDSIQNRAAYFAKELHNSMAGMGTNDRALIRLVVSRCEIDMGNIKGEYQKIYGKPLEKAIKGDTSGDYKKLLLALIGA